MSENNSEQVAKKVVERLVSESLLEPERKEKFLTSLASGRLREEDWRLALENAILKATKP